MLLLSKRRSNRKSRRPINIHQNSFKKGYISTLANSRSPQDSLEDLTNMEIVQDGIPRIRQSTTAYGTQTLLTIVGRGKYAYGGERWELFVLDDGGVGKVYKRKDGGTLTEVTGNTYSVSVWTQFTQSKNRVYAYNSSDYLSYLDLSDGTLKKYTSLTTPGTPTPTKTGLTGTNYTYYYKVAANNAVGTSTASSAGSITTDLLRNSTNWSAATNYVTLTWSAVSGATSYNVYVGSSAGNEKLVFTTGGSTLSWKDDGSITPDPFTLAPVDNSTQGFIPTWIYNDTRNSQIFALDSGNKLYYSSTTSSTQGDFSFNEGGGYSTINKDGDSTLNFIDGFRDGKGNPVITFSARASAGKGNMFHATVDSATYGDTTWSYLNVYEANGKSGTYAPRATVKYGDSLAYPTGMDIKSTGTSQNIVNILTTNSIANVIQPDLETITLSALSGAVGLEYQGKIYFALPVGASFNNQIWYMDSARNNLWVLRWTFTDAIKDLYLYEDNDGITHFCIIVGNRILEFTRGLYSEDDGEAFSTRCAFSALVWDEDGLVMANIRRQYYKFLDFRGTANIVATGLDKEGATNTIGSETFTQNSAKTGWDTFLFDEHVFDEDPGTIATFGKSISSAKVKINARMINQLSWEVTTNTKGCDYILAAVNTQGTTNDKRKLGD